MGKKIIGNTFTLPSPLDTKSSNPIDTRTVVETLSDLYNPDTFGTSGKYCFVHEGLNVYVSSDKATYMYIGPIDMEGGGVLSTEVAKEENWVKTASSVSESELDAMKATINSLPAGPLITAGISVDDEGHINAPYYVKDSEGIYHQNAPTVLGNIPMASITSAGLMSVDYTRANSSQSVAGDTSKYPTFEYQGRGVFGISNICKPSINTIGNAKYISFQPYNVNIPCISPIAQTDASNVGLLSREDITRLYRLPDGIAIKYEDQTIKLVDKDNNLVSSISAEEFIKDGILDNVELIGNDLLFEFNTDSGKQAIRVDLTKFIDVYTAGRGINIDGNEISLDEDVVHDIIDNSFTTTTPSGLERSNLVTSPILNISLEKVLGKWQIRCIPFVYDGSRDPDKNAGNIVQEKALAAIKIGIDSDIQASKDNITTLSEQKADKDELFDYYAERVVDDNNFEDISQVTREELKKDLFIDMWNSACNTFGQYNATTGYFELNGLTDITYEEALDIYRYGTYPEAYYFLQCLHWIQSIEEIPQIRTTIPTFARANTRAYPNLSWLPRKLTKVKFNSSDYSRGDYLYLSSSTLELCSTEIEELLDAIVLDAKCITIGKIAKAPYDPYCTKLRTIYILLLDHSITINLPAISLESLEYLVEHANNGSHPITVTVHPDVYAKLTDTANTEWYAILTAAANKNISFATA